ncbi:hypothetical protein AYL99_01776 [Fonsecaea erecta]|uniref:Ketosynthase family 3 (KS3) domain-containing protein n=1 Tax=Fonsecaea erecta TaxID=1367422 RepID=A0A178ZRW7_9EURO|nr:hypothetical protein AYL99_01776 [Fonsecaea erecta]OAP62549.1 hypothetical protein AYL99_01776 [Fonsecaea erecta]
MGDEIQYTPTEQQLTRVLMIELLAIKTQDTILRDFSTERLIEIGPAETLTNMAAKTIKSSGYDISDVALGLERQLLSYKRDRDAIYYRYQVEEGAESSPEPAQPAVSEMPTKAEAPRLAKSVQEEAPEMAIQTPQISIPDQPVTAIELLTAVVALALKKTPSEVVQDQTIKALSGGKLHHSLVSWRISWTWVNSRPKPMSGRSTVQNEIIGDLIEEFGWLPDQPEEVPLAELGDLISSSRTGSKLGPCTSKVVGKVMSTKMPAGFGVAVSRRYLSSIWHFAQGLQDRTLLLAAFRPPQTRLSNEKEGQSYLNDVAQQALLDIGVQPSAFMSECKDQHSRASDIVPSAALNSLRAEQHKRDLDLLKVFAKRTEQDIHCVSAKETGMKMQLDDLQGRVDAWSAEHGEAYERGIMPKFDSKKIRKYDSYWNWVIQDLYAIYSTASSGDIKKIGAQAEDSYGHLSRRVTRQLLDTIQRLLDTVEDITPILTRKAIELWLHGLQKACKEASCQARPRLKYSGISTIPILNISEEGRISVSTIPRQIPKQYSFSASSDADAVFSLLQTVENSAAESAPSTPQSAEAVSPRLPPASCAWTPEMQTKAQNGWHRNEKITVAYTHCFRQAATEGLSFHGKTVLVTGAGKNSIGLEMVRLCLAAGAAVLVTTSSYSQDTVAYYKELYQFHGARGSQLVVVPWNGGSSQDVHGLVRYIYEEIGWDPDHILPFAAISVVGHAVDDLDDKSELAQRVMLTNLLRLLGCIKAEKARRRIRTHPTQVILPLSPNHGSFGQDGLYAESKLALEALLNKWWSEDWRDYLTLCGAVIGWTRGTGLMHNNDVLAAGLEKDVGIRTFSSTEMAWNLLALMDVSMASFCDTEPIKADLSGGLSAHMTLQPVLKQIQNEIQSQAAIKRALYRELQETEPASSLTPLTKVPRKASIRMQSMDLPDWEEIKSTAEQLDGMVDLNRVVVVVGFGEAGPCGSARTRWEAECSGTFSIHGCLELAWIMGLVKYHNGPLQGKDYSGWIDVATKEPIADADIKAKYEDHIIQHTGIRLVEQRQHDLTTPDRQQVLCEVAIKEDLEPFEVSLDTARDLQREHGTENVLIGTEVAEGQVMVTLRAGTTIFIPRAAKLGRAVGAQMPLGWDARTYGIPEDVIAQVDPTTLYALVATAEAFLSSGITDAFELFDHIHVGELGNAIGSGLGGQRSSHAMFKQRFLGRQVQKDVLAETFLNTTAAWINMLLCGASGPIRTPVGACATALESVDTGFDLIINGRAKAVLVGGVDNLERDIAHEFANMHATVDANVDASAGRSPKDASRPTTTTRAGFVEGEGCGVQLLTTAQLALDMGLPIKAIVAMAHTASDKVGRSVPAPGKGILTAATEKRGGPVSPLLSLPYRRRQLEHSLRQIEEYCATEDGWLDEWLAEQCVRPGETAASENAEVVESVTAYRRQVDADAQRSIRDARYRYGNGFWRDEPSISPLRGALAVWGLTVDDLSIASLHGTSTPKNDVNETAVLQTQLQWLGRKKGNLLPCVSQKSLLGHGKGAAGAFALNGCLQSLRTGFIPGNRNADNIDCQLRDRDLLFFPSQTYRSSSAIKAFSVTSFGFGQKGAQVVGVNPRYLLATIGEGSYKTYKAKVKDRELNANRTLQSDIAGGKLVRVKERSTYSDDMVEVNLLNR